MTKWLVGIWFFASVGFWSGFASAQDPGDYYVAVPALNERSAPKTGAVVNRVYLRQKLTVYEVHDGWGQVSPPGYVKRWVSMRFLSKAKPPLPDQGDIAAKHSDPRIASNAIPKVGEHGLNKRDIEILWRGAKQMLDSGRCSRVELADKSVSRAGTYYVNCGGPNLFFTEADLK